VNAAQQRMYWIEFGKAWTARLGCGGTPANREIWRKQLHVRIGAVDRKGVPRSSTRFSNLDLDRFLGICRGYSNSSSLEAQLEIETQPVKRALVACAPLLDELHMAEVDREAYIAGIYRNVQRGREGRNEATFELHEMPDLDLGLVVAALTHTVEHKLGIDHLHPSNKSRAAWGHRVGHRRIEAGRAEEAAQLAEEVEDETVHREPDPAYHPPANEAF